VTVQTHDGELAKAFDQQAAGFERAPVQSDPVALARLVEFAQLPPGSRVLDAGCGPGLVAEAFLSAGHRVFGIDLAAEMVRRARARCERFLERARFEQGSVFDLQSHPFDAAVSRFVLHHAEDPVAFLRAQAQRVRPGGVIVASDHATDSEGGAQRWHQEIERARDKTHVRNLTPGGLVDALARAGLRFVRLEEDEFVLDFDEWFDRGTPALPKDEVRALVLAGRARGFDPVVRPDGGISIRCVRLVARAETGDTMRNSG
jgi:SAM-dependent methyltransferase